MANLYSHLQFEFQNIGNSLGEIPKEIYRYFGTEKDRANFLKGNIWFSGKNQNRFFVNEPDKFEYRNSIGTFLGEYSLSCSLEVLYKNKPTIKIINVEAFIQEIITTLRQNKNHYVSWLSIDDLKQLAPEDLSINNIGNNPTTENEIITLWLDSAGGGKVIYEDKLITLQQGYDPTQVAVNARNKNKKKRI